MEHKTESNNLIISKLDEKSIIWLPEVNKYIVVIPPADEIIELIHQAKDDEIIQDYCVDKWSFSYEEAKQYIQQIKFNLKNIYSNQPFPNTKNKSNSAQPASLECKRYYRINDLVFFIEYETTEVEYLVHPKFAHLEIPEFPAFDNHFQLFKLGSDIALIVNGKIIGTWEKKQNHFLTGKVSMEVLQKIYNNQENDWMAVFHAAGISNGKESIMFLGDSGNGKSTLSAILMANGFNVLADDFLPVESKTQKLCSFPAAISIKKQAIDFLSAHFPELKNSKEYYYPLFDKTVRYLTPPGSSEKTLQKVPCKALIFVKHETNTGLQFNRLSKHTAFQKLVPDSWISPLGKNAEQFLNWFEKLPCYQLTYSDNKAMVETVKNIFDNKSLLSGKNKKLCDVKEELKRND